eukprot:584274-Pleurochrysis_carterae.AAC.1
MQKVAGVLVNVEAEQVSGKKAKKNLSSQRQRAVHLKRRPRRVQEPSNLEPRLSRAQQRRQQHQVVVVHPHHVALASDCLDDFGKLGIDCLVRLPLVALAPSAGAFFTHARDDIVEERPEHVVAEAVVVEPRLLLWQKDGDATTPPQRAANSLLLFRRRIVYICPSHPDDPHMLHAQQRRDHPARADRVRELAVGQALDAEGQPVGDHHHARRALLNPQTVEPCRATLALQTTVELEDLADDSLLAVLGRVEHGRERDCPR